MTLHSRVSVGPRVGLAVSAAAASLTLAGGVSLAALFGWIAPTADGTVSEPSSPLASVALDPASSSTLGPTLTAPAVAEPVSQLPPRVVLVPVQPDTPVSAQPAPVGPPPAAPLEEQPAPRAVPPLQAPAPRLVGPAQPALVAPQAARVVAADDRVEREDRGGRRGGEDDGRRVREAADDSGGHGRGGRGGRDDG